ncbi:MAG: class I SAM-dependent methyltransferase [Bacteroidota bacterium]
MSKHKQPDHQEVRDFYDTLAPEYDAMTSFEQRFIREKPFFRMLIERYGIRTAIDAGCGTGFHSLLLAQLGVKVTAVDLSPEMLTRVRDHAETMDIKLTTLQAEFHKLAAIVREPVDAVFSLGNSLAHLLSAEELTDALKNFAALLRPNGVLLLQNLNYHRILLQRERVQSIKDNGTKTYVRFYDFTDPLVFFNILTIDRQEGSIRQTLHTVPLRPILLDEIVPLLRSAGFSEIKAFGGISMEEFRPESSQDLVILARTAEMGGPRSSLKAERRE